MRRTQSVRHNARPSLALAADDLGMLREADETNEDILRRQLIERDRECDRLRMSNEALTTQLGQRPPIEAYQTLQREFKDLDLILQGTQRENEKCMADLERVKAREKLLERELTRLAGDNWQANLEIPPLSSLPLRSSAAVNGGLNMLHQRSSTISSPISHNMARNHSPTPSLRHDVSGSRPGSYHGSSNAPTRLSGSPLPQQQDHSDPHSSQQQDQYQSQREIEAKRLAQIEQVRMLILGMDQKLDVREGKLTKMLERAEVEGRRYEGKVVEAQNAGISISGPA